VYFRILGEFWKILGEYCAKVGGYLAQGRTAEKGRKKARKSMKKVAEMFGGLPNFSYLCTVKIKDISREKQAVGGWPMYSVAVSLIR